ncbi:MAG TPA: ABC transporter permease [Vicinamibacterales bacterium]|jgi:predicted permease
MIETIWQDLRHGARMLFKNPGFTFVAVVSIALGVGANTAMFSVADGLVLRPLQVPRANEVVGINATTPRVSDTFIVNTLLSHPDYVDLRDRATSFTGVLAYHVVLTSFSDRRDQPAQTKLGFAVSGNFFDVLQLRPALGRTFLAEEDRVAGRDAVVVLAYDTWADQFGSDPGVIGRQIRMGDTDFTVIGVAPQGFTGMRLALPAAYYIPLAITSSLPGALPNALERRDLRVLEVRARLKPGVSIEQAREETALIARALERTHPDTNRNYGMLVRSAMQTRLDERGPSAPGAFMLLTLALVVLLVACANVAGLLMSRAPERQPEIALRMAIGGGRGRVARQLVTESVLLAVGGGVLGLAIGYGVVVFFRGMPIVSDIGVRLTFDLDRRAILVGLVVAAASALLSSLVPAWRATQRLDLATTLRTSTADGRHRLWGRNGLVVGQVALTLMMLTAAVSLSRAAAAELSQPGFRTERILLAGFEPMLARYNVQQTDAFYTRLKERVRAIPGVTSVGMTSVMPLNQDYRDPAAIAPEGFQLPRGTVSITVLSSRIDEGYLDTLGIRLLQGRNVGAADVATSPRIALVNQAMAMRYWPGQSPIGKRVRLMDRDGQPWAEVVGVTADSKYNWIGEAPTSWIYFAQRQDQGFRSTLIVGAAGSAASLAAPIRDSIRDIDPNMPIAGMRTMEDFYYGNATAVVSTLTRVTGGMGLMGLMLAIVGLYGLVAYAVARRTREIGIRMAIGAKPSIVLQSVLRQGFVLAAWGIGFGVIGCIAAGGLLRAAFPNTGRIDATTYALVVSTLVIVMLLASYVPARRAARIDPLRALRAD